MRISGREVVGESGSGKKAGSVEGGNGSTVSN